MTFLAIAVLLVAAFLILTRDAKGTQSECVQERSFDAPNAASQQHLRYLDPDPHNDKSDPYDADFMFDKD